MVGDVLQIQSLGWCSRADIVAPRAQRVCVGRHVRVTGQHQLHVFFGYGFGCALEHGLQHFQSAVGVDLEAVNFEFLVAVRNLDLQTSFYGAQMFIQRAA